MLARRREFLMALSAFAFGGCKAMNLMPFQDKDQLKKDTTNKNVREALSGDGKHSKLIGDYIRFADATLRKIKVQGVGLVDHLDGTGEDPPASPFRTQLLDDMRRHEIRNPQTYLSSTNTALVIVTAYIDPIIQKNGRIDVEITLPDGSQATSLEGGWLMPCFLREHMLGNGEIKKGKEIALATGPVLVDALGGDARRGDPGLLRGRIPAGAIYNGNERMLTIGIGNEYRTVRMSKTIADRIGRRFHDYDGHGNKQALAKAKTDSLLELKVHDRYRENWPRYIQCIRHMALTETPVDKHLRMQRLSEEILIGPTAEKASMELEAIGPETIPILKQGLSSDDFEARFHAAMALAYLNSTDGVKILEEAASQEPAFRAYALAALGSLQDGSAAESLRNLMNHESVETRYGAFRAMISIAPNDPFVKGTDMPGGFKLHQIESDSSPLIHVTRHKRAEIVIFNTDQEFRTPLLLKAGKKILIQETSHGRQLVIKKITSQQTQERIVSPRVVDVINAACELDASYPDIVQLLVQAERQKNLPGLVAVDQYPQTGRVYERPKSSNLPFGESSTTVGSKNMAPNLFEDEQANIDNTPSLPSLPETSNEIFLK